jgi:hypothetical protein
MSLIRIGDKIYPEQHPLKQKLFDTGITIGAAAHYCGRSYAYLLNMLSSKEPMPDSTQEKIEELISLVESGKI